MARSPSDRPGDDELMRAAVDVAWTARTRAAPNPWVGAALRDADGQVVVGATRPPGGAHAEIEVLSAAGERARGATLATTLEPCDHTGRTGPCSQAIIDAGVTRVLVGLEDPDPNVAGSGIARLRAAGIEVGVGIEAGAIGEQLAAYLHHRRTGRPYVVAKLAMTLDARTAAPDRTSQWITGEAARRDAHQLRAESQAILVGAGTVRADDPSLTTRLVEGPSPRRIVLGSAPDHARVHPCLEWRGELDELLDQLGDDGVLQLMVEGGASTISQFLDEDLVDRFVLYVAPAMFGGDDARPVFVGAGAPTMAALRRGRIRDIRRVGDDVRIDYDPDRRGP